MVKLEASKRMSAWPELIPYMRLNLEYRLVKAEQKPDFSKRVDSPVIYTSASFTPQRQPWALIRALGPGFEWNRATMCIVLCCTIHNSVGCPSPAKRRARLLYEVCMDTEWNR